MEKEIKYLIFHVDNDEEITDDCLEDIETQLISVTKEDVLYLVIRTNGGSPFSAVAIMNVLQNKFDKIYAVIPKYAMSAGTLMALGTDKIYMGVRSGIGPLDLPIEHPTDGSRISALDIKNAAVEVATLSDLVAQKRYKTLRGGDRSLSRVDAAKIAFETATEFTKPVTSRIDPYILSNSIRALRIGRDYAVDMLTSRMMKGQYEKAVETATRLVNIYPVHEYSIFSREAERFLHLTIGDLSVLPEWGIIKDDVEKICEGKDYVIKFERKTVPIVQAPATPKTIIKTNAELPSTK